MAFAYEYISKQLKEKIAGTTAEEDSDLGPPEVIENHNGIGKRERVLLQWLINRRIIHMGN